jgi:YD repeat-containing protein
MRVIRITERGRPSQLVEVPGAASGVRYVTDAASTYDAYGRTATVTDATGHTSTITYTPAIGLPTSSKVTGPPVKPGDSSTALSTSNDLDPAWNLRTSNTDAGSKRTDVEYDALGRLINGFEVEMWLNKETRMI